MGVPRIIALIRDMLKTNLVDRDTLMRIQDQRLRAMLRHAVAHSDFYRKKYKGIDIETCKITDLPVITKSEMMANFDDFVCDKRLKRSEIKVWLEDKSNLGKMYKGKYIPFQTSGTTGENALVVYDRRAMDHVHATVIARHALEEEPTGWEQLKIFLETLFVRRNRIASIVMTGGPYPAYTATLFTPKAHALFVEERIFPLRDPIDKIVKGLNEFQPVSIMSYPSLLALLAREQIAGRLDIKFDHPMSWLITGSEPLSTSAKLLVKKAWGKGVQDTYGTAECLIMARCCRQFDRLHVMSDQCVFEVVDRNNNPVPDGQVGEKVLITNLFNFAQPFIRYEVSDVTGYSLEKCSCGLPFPTLMPVEGRTDDIFYIDRPGGGYEAVHPYLFLGPIVELTDVREYRLTQTGRNEVTFSYIPVSPDMDIDARVQKVLMDGVAKANLAERFHMKFECVSEIPRDKRSGKYRQIISVVGAPKDLNESEKWDH